jgi:hypothetical protein
MTKVLVAGWFSFERMGASAGDLITRDLVCNRLTEEGHEFDVALAPPFDGGVDWRQADPEAYSVLVFVCGPLGDGPPVDEMFERFRDLPMIGINLSMLDALEVWNPFDVLIERDSSRAARPDLAYLGAEPDVPVVGVVLIDTQDEYGQRDRHLFADEIIDRVLARLEVARVEIDTRLDEGTNTLRTPGEIEALIARMDLVVTTRLHGTVLALKNAVPVVAIDSVSGGAKVSRQAELLDWPALITADDLGEESLERAIDWCLTGDAHELARRCRDRAREILGGALDEVSDFLSRRA